MPGADLRLADGQRDDSLRCWPMANFKRAHGIAWDRPRDVNRRQPPGGASQVDAWFHFNFTSNMSLALVPFQGIDRSGADVQAAVQKDLGVLRRELRVRCASTVLVTGMESEEGFQELVNRVDPVLTQNKMGRASWRERV